MKRDLVNTKPLGGSHRRSVSDGNDPSGLFNFKHGSSIPGPTADQKHPDGHTKDSGRDAAGK